MGGIVAKLMGGIIAIFMALNIIGVMWYLILKNGTGAALGALVLSFIIMFFSAALAGSKNETR
jgi:hypothetical protein